MRKDVLVLRAAGLIRPAATFEIIMKQILMFPSGHCAKVDDWNFYWLLQYNWHAQIHQDGKIYATVKINGKTIYMHRLIMKCSHDKFIDHKNNDSLDNQEHNLREATNSENIQNSSKNRIKSSKYKGVSLNKASRKWDSRIKLNGKNLYLGCFDFEIDAAKRYNEEALKLFGKFARLNIVN